jgi:starch phosphorylase
MVTDYVTTLYVPAARAGWAMDHDDHAAARELAAWKARVRAAWPQLRVDHVESSGISDSPQLGDVLAVRAFIYLDGIGPDDVQVQVVHGRVSDADELADTEVVPLTLTESYDGGQHRFEGRVQLSRTGAFGYTVRVLPRHQGLASLAELGLVTHAAT